MPKHIPDPALDPQKTETKMLATRIFMHAENASIAVLKKVIAIINNCRSEKTISKIRAELADILLEIDMGSIASPDPYFEAMVHGYIQKP